MISIDKAIYKVSEDQMEFLRVLRKLRICEPRCWNIYGEHMWEIYFHEDS